MSKTARFLCAVAFIMLQAWLVSVAFSAGAQAVQNACAEEVLLERSQM